MKHRHNGPKVRYKTKKGRIRLRKRPLHKLTFIPFKSPKTTNKIPKGSYIAQEKRDGERLEFIDYGDTGRLINRRRVDKTTQFPEFKNLARQMPGKNIIDNEGVVFNEKGDDDFKLWSQRSHLKNKGLIEKSAKERPATLIGLDIMNYRNRDVRNLPWKKRNEMLKSLPASDRFRIIKSYPKEKAREIMKDKSVEGVVFKKIDSVYDNKKDNNWLKWKQKQSADLVITGYEEGKGKRRGMVGSVYSGVWDKRKIKPVGKIGSFKGFTDNDLRSLKKRLDKLMTGKENNIVKVKPSLFVKASYLKKGSRGNLREPKVIGIRTDIGLKDTHTSKIIKEKKGRIVTTRSPKEVKMLAKKIEKRLKPYSKKIEVAGSIRRRKDPIDIDIVAIPKDKNRIKDILRKMGPTIQEGEQKVGYNIKDVKTEVYFAEPKSWGSKLLFATGSGGHNIGLRKLAKDKGMKLNQHGLWRNSKLIASKTERDIYNALDRPRFKQPWERY